MCRRDVAGNVPMIDMGSEAPVERGRKGADLSDFAFDLSASRCRQFVYMRASIMNFSHGTKCKIREYFRH